MRASGAASPANAPLDVAVLRDRAAWDRIAREWDALHAVSKVASPPLSREWMAAWWDVYGETLSDGAAALRLVTVRRDGALIGLLPLYARRPDLPLLGYRRLGFLSTGEDEIEETCPDYLECLSAPGEEQACARAVRGFLVAAPFVWHRLDLLDVRLGSALLDAGGWPASFHAFTEERGSCPSAHIEGGIDAWLARLPSRKREQPRRGLREVERSGASFEVAGPEEIDAFFDQLVQLHQQRWTSAGEPGCFAAPRFTNFHRRLAHAFVPDGRAVLARLTLDGRALAVLYGFVARERFHFYQSGAAAAADPRIKSPGVAAHVLLMRHLADRGVAYYDFLRGSAAYKERLATDDTPLGALHVERIGLRALAWHGVHFARRALGRVLSFEF